MLNHVSDTSAWVAYYRALETDRNDSIFKDQFAKILIGERSIEFAKAKSNMNKWTNWTVVMRTFIIDNMIKDLISQGHTTFLNLGAGLDSRPYRMQLDSKLKWIEVDFPHLIEIKNEILSTFNPCCNLERIGLDLSKRDERISLFKSLNERFETIVVLTEGVLPYLSEVQVAELSEDMKSFPSFNYWICEYISPKSYSVLKNPKQMKALKDTPFKFFPEEWMNFFESKGWKLVDIKYYVDTSEQLGRATPFPVIFKIISFILGKKWSLSFRRMHGYIMWKR
jgi:methyltransferase (TIGR00027 family)